MGVTFTAFVNGTPMVAADVRTEIDKIRTFLNGGVVAADVVGPFKRQHFHRTTNYGGTSPRTLGVVAESAYGAIDASPANRAVFVYDSDEVNTEEEWRWIWGATRTLKFPAAGQAALAVTLWTWHIGSNLEYPELQQWGSTGKFPPAAIRLAMQPIGDDVEGQEHSRHEVHDAGKDPAGGSGGNGAGPNRYSGASVTMSTVFTIADAGTYTLGAQVLMRTGASDVMGTLYAGARSPLVSYQRS